MILKKKPRNSALASSHDSVVRSLPVSVSTLQEGCSSMEFTL